MKSRTKSFYKPEALWVSAEITVKVRRKHEIAVSGVVLPCFALPFLMKHLLRFAILPALTGLTSCASLYFPPPPHAPLLTHQGEAYGSISTNIQNNFAIQGAYAVTDHIGVAGTFSSLQRSRTRKTENLDFGELSVGYFTRLSDKRVLEVYVGAGGGATERIERNAEKITTRTLDGSLSKVFAQVNYARKKRDNITSSTATFRSPTARPCA
jgi:hypothetical protein